LDALTGELVAVVDQKRGSGPRQRRGFGPHSSRRAAWEAPLGFSDDRQVTTLP
jgi:hypothetical protein